jgi:branched-chain amino acid transport system permease protein
MSDFNRSRLLRYGIGGLAALTAPLYLGEYFLYIASLTIVYTLASFGTNILSGYTNLLSLAGATFFGCGAFGTAILMSKYGVPFLPAIVLTGLLVVVLGLVVAIPTLRLEHVYLAIATLGYVFIFGEIVKGTEGLTGGTMGMGVPMVSFFGYRLNEVGLYYLNLTTVTLLLSAGVNLSRSRFGRAFFAVKGSEVAARSLGIPAHRIKVTAFAVQAFYCAISGGLYGFLVRFIDPSLFSIFISISFLSMVIIGGLGSVLGSILGALFVIVTPQLLTYFGLTEVQRSVYGVAMILSLTLLPNGLVSLPGKLHWLRKLLGRSG